MTNAELIDEFLAWMEAYGLSVNTLKLRRVYLRAFAARVDLATATETDVIAMLNSRSHQRPESRHALQASLMSFYGWAVPRGHAVQNPTAHVPRIRVPQGLPKPITEPALHMAMAAADAETLLMLLLGAYAGLRLSEIAAVHADDFDGAFLRVTGKGDKIRRIAVHPLLAPHLDAVDGWAFPSKLQPDRHACNSYISKRIGRVLPTPYTPHSLRHRFATRAYQSSRDLFVVQKLLGHSQPTTTQRYVLLDDDDLVRVVNLIAA